MLSGEEPLLATRGVSKPFERPYRRKPFFPHGGKTFFPPPSPPSRTADDRLLEESLRVAPFGRPS